jgi:MFS family permease
MTTGLIMPPYGELFSKSILRHRGRLYGGVQLLGGLLGAAGALVANRLLQALDEPLGMQAVFWLAFALSFLSLAFIAGIREVPFPDVRPRGTLRALVGSVPALLRENRSYRWFLVGRSAIALGMSGLGFVAAAALDRGLTPADAAGFASAYLLSQSVGGLGWGLLGDRFGWKLVLLGGGLALAIGMVLAMTAATFATFALSFAFLGLTYAAALTSDPNITYEVAPPDDTSRYLGVTSTLTAPALTVAPLLGALLASVTSYPILFGASALLAVLGVGVAAAKFEEPRRRVAMSTPPSISG